MSDSPTCYWCEYEGADEWYLTEDGFLCSECYRDIVAELGDFEATRV